MSALVTDAPGHGVYCLPSEITSDILLMTGDPPEHLSSFSSRLREIAVGTAALWSTINIPPPHQLDRLLLYLE